MKTFNEKDLITWSNHDKAIIGKLFYFGYCLESIQSKIETGIEINGEWKSFGILDD